MIIYLHGFNSSPQSHKAQVLAAYLAEHGYGAQYACPALPYVPKDAIAIAEDEIARRRREAITLVGSSLGGYYATYLAERHDLRAVLLNPAVFPHEDLRAYLGEQRNLHTLHAYELTREHLRQLEALEQTRITPERYLLIVETADEVLDYRQAVAKYAGAQQIVVPGGDHSLASFAEHIPAILDFARLGAI